MTTLSDSTRRRLLVRLVAVAIIVAGGWLSLELLPALAQRQGFAPGELLQWQPFTDRKLFEAAGQNRWAVVDFTADWCPNCILVEKAVLRNQKVLQAFKKHNALLLKADLTRANPPAQQLLEKLGSRSIPFLALFPPGEQFWQPFFLRDIYRTEDVLQVFPEISGD
jgi:thiol:disulfide interchange protein DsbD